MKRYRIRKRHDRWEILRPSGKHVSPIKGSRSSLDDAMNAVCELLRQEQRIALALARAE